MEILKEFEGEDVIYHYCPIDTAVKYILHEKRLRLSLRSQATDPFESYKPLFSYRYYGDEIFSYPEERIATEHLSDKVRNVKQLSFCRNRGQVSDNIYAQTPLEHFGFAKPRMWDQYAEKYRGVCLAFSLRKLAENLPGHIVYNKVKYLNFGELSTTDWSFNVNNLIEKKQGYVDARNNQFTQYLFRKHTDYRDENELKFLSFNSSEYDYLDISNSLKGIFFNKNEIGAFDWKSLSNFSHEYGVQLIGLKWQWGSLNIITQKNDEALAKVLRDAINSDPDILSDLNAP